MLRYATIDRPLGGHAEAEIVVQRSRFLAHVARVDDETAARDVIVAVRERHRDARHHCTAFVLGADRALRRSNDDGEPSGTAGRPILDAIDGRRLSDVVVVVSRWFGGTLLGTGGLTRAYGDAAAAALDAAGVRRRESWTEVVIGATHAEAGALEHQLRQLGRLIDVTYGDEVRFRLAVRDESELERIDFVVAGPWWTDVQ